MAELFDRMLSPEILDRAWRRLRNDPTQWQPGLSRSEMERQLLKHLLRLVEEVQSGTYRPEGLRRFTIRKPGGGERIISALTLKDKLLQTAAMLVLTPQMEKLFHPDSFGYRPGRNVGMALGRVRERVRCGLDWLVDADIRSFFDEIPHQTLRKRLRRYIPDPELLRLMDQWLACGYAQNSLFGPRRGIPQGAVLSPLWCNLYLTELDRLWHRKNLAFVRYADDFLLQLPDRRSAEKALALTEKRLNKLGLALNQEKTRITRAGPHVVFLGEKLPKKRRP